MEPETNTDVDTEDAKLQALMHWSNSLNKIYNPDDAHKTLYHYTDFAGLEGILGTHRLWATYNRALNDISEQHHAEGVLRKELARLSQKPTDSSIVPADLGARKHFVACFCQSDELLSMWRAYAGNGGGYCLGFDYSGLRRMWWPKPKVGQSHPLVARVYYGDTPPEAIQAHLDAIFSVAAANGSDTEELVSHISPFLPSMIKHKSFSEEKEWRIVALDPPLEHRKFRPGNACIRPYTELSWLHLGEPRNNKLPLVSITVGPTLRADGHPEEIIGWMLEHYGYTDVEVKSSNIPYRA